MISDTVSGLVNSLTEKADKAVDWFHVNKMIVNPEKFKAILLTKSRIPLDTPLFKRS